MDNSSQQPPDLATGVSFSERLLFLGGVLHGQKRDVLVGQHTWVAHRPSSLLVAWKPDEKGWTPEPPPFAEDVYQRREYAAPSMLRTRYVMVLSGTGDQRAQDLLVEYLLERWVSEGGHATA